MYLKVREWIDWKLFGAVSGLQVWKDALVSFHKDSAIKASERGRVVYWMYRRAVQLRSAMAYTLRYSNRWRDLLSTDAMTYAISLGSSNVKTLSDIPKPNPPLNEQDFN